MTGLLRGVKVVEAAVLLVGDYLGMLLGDEGADVIKLEQPGIGDYLRKILGQFAPDNSPLHVMVNRNKRSLTLDPRSPDGAEVFRRLIAETDVFVTGHVGDVPAKLGMDYETLRAINPRHRLLPVDGVRRRGALRDDPHPRGDDGEARRLTHARRSASWAASSRSPRACRPAA